MNVDLLSVGVSAAVALVVSMLFHTYKASVRKHALLRAIRGEAADLRDFLSNKLDVVDRSIGALSTGDVLPGQHVRHPSAIYRGNLAELSLHLSADERKVLLRAYEVARVLDDTLENQEADLIRIARIAPKADAHEIVANKLKEVRLSVQKEIAQLDTFAPTR